MLLFSSDPKKSHHNNTSRFSQTVLATMVGVIVTIFPTVAQAEMVQLNLLQLNDVYEMTPLSGGKEAGLARVATIRKALLKENPQTYTILAGDLVSPSALGTAVVNGEKLAGKQMVAVMNHLLDFATFGNHEFDLNEAQFYARLQESTFKWFSGNVFTADHQAIAKVPKYLIINVPKKDGGTVKIGLIGATLPSNPSKYISYSDPIAEIRQNVAELKGNVDLIIAVTHLNIAQDQLLAETVPEINLILGGHEHENIQQWRGKDFTPIFKADANARSVYIHHLSYDTDTKHLDIQSQLQPITDAIADDPDTAKLIKQWQDQAFAAFRANGFEPEAVIATSTMPLDGLESSVRNNSTDLTDLVAQAMLHHGDRADLSIFNGGSIRIDDILPPGKITQYDVLRMMPFGGKILTVGIKGRLLEQILQQGLANEGTGGYVQTSQVSRSMDGNHWLINNQILDRNKIYRVAINDFLLSGKETGLDYLTLNHSDIDLLQEGEDIRFALIEQLKQTFPSPQPSR